MGAAPWCCTGGGVKGLAWGPAWDCVCIPEACGRLGEAGRGAGRGEGAAGRAERS